MTEPDPVTLIRQFIGGDATVITRITASARTSRTPAILVAAALITPRRGADLLTRADAVATSNRDRQIVAIAAAHLAGDRGRVVDLARDHLADHPDSLLAAWIAAAGF